MTPLTQKPQMCKTENFTFKEPENVFSNPKYFFIIENVHDEMCKNST